jgi:hypothetical protein
MIKHAVHTTVASSLIGTRHGVHINAWAFCCYFECAQIKVSKDYFAVNGYNSGAHASVHRCL